MRKEVPYFVILDHLLLKFVHFSLKKHSCLFIPCRHYSFFMPSRMFIIIESFFYPSVKKWFTSVVHYLEGLWILQTPLSAVLWAEKQTMPLTFPMTLTQIPICIDQKKGNMNGICPFLLFTMPHSFQSDRGRTENHKLGVKGLFLITTFPWGPHILFFLHLKKPSHFVQMLFLTQCYWQF